MSFSNYRNIENEYFANHLRRYIGETVIVFTTSGGLSGSGFTGVLLSVNCEFIRLDSRRGSAPDCPIGTFFPGDFNGDFEDSNYGNESYGNDNNCKHKRRRRQDFGSVVDIPIDSIVAFVHNAI